MQNNNNEHAMLKEIREQPGIIDEIIKRHIKKDKIVFTEMKGKTAKLKKIKKFIILACGSSYYAGIYGKYVLEEYAGLEVCVEYASEANSRKLDIDNKTGIIAISQSGKTADVLSAVKNAKPKAGLIISITNSPDSKLAALSDVVLDCAAGEETAVAATKTFSSTLLLLLLFGLYLNGKSDEKIREYLSKLPLYMEGAIRAGDEIKTIANAYKNTKHFLFCGRKFYFPLALEGAHKMKECSYVHAEGLPTGELRHGTLALINEGMPVFFLLPNDEFLSADLQVIQAAKKAGGSIIVLTSLGVKGVKRLSDIVIYLKDLPDVIEPIVFSASLQMLACYLSLAKGLDPDKPRNQSKYVV